MKVTYYSEQNRISADKPNEDAFYCDIDEKIFIVLDGVSRDRQNGAYPDPSPARDVSSLLIDTISAHLLKPQSGMNNPFEMMLSAVSAGNMEVGRYNEKNRMHVFPAGAVGIVSLIAENSFYYSYIGDCCGWAIGQNGCGMFTESQTRKVHEHIKQYTAGEVRGTICNSISHPDGYGVINGDPRAMDFLKMGRISLQDVDYILLASDGMEEWLEQSNPDEIKYKNAETIIQESLCGRNKDDKTLIKLDL